MTDSIIARWKLSRYLVPSPVLTICGGEPSRLLYSTRSGARIAISESAWLSLCQDGWDLIPADLLQGLVAAKVIVPAVTDELADVVAENQEACATTRELVQILQPSASCQLGCVYCGQEHAQARMGSELHDRLAGRIRRRLQIAREAGTGYESVLIGWFGGEPLLGMPAIRALSPTLQALATEYGCSYSSRVVTNGLRLSPEIALELQESHHVQHIEVTLDGPPSQHDKRRPTKAGKPTFEAIANNLVALARESRIRFQLAIRCNVDQSNAADVPALIDLLADRGLHERFALYFSPVYAWGNDAGARALDAAEYAEREIEWFALMMRRGFSVGLLPSRRPITCLAVRRDGRVTDAYGGEFNCTEVSYVPAYGQPNVYQIGHVRDDAEGKPLFNDWNERIGHDTTLPCHSCRMLPVCGGACPKAWAEGARPCPSSRLNISDRLLLSLAQSRMATP